MDKQEIMVICAIGAAVLTVGSIIVVEQGSSGPSETSGQITSDLVRSITTDAELKDFVGITTRGVWQVTITPGDTWQVELSYPEDYEDRLRVRVEGDRLVLGLRSESWPFWRNWGRQRAEAPSARVVMPAFTALIVSGAAVVDFGGFSGETLAIAVSGAGKLVGTEGHYQQLALTVSGAGDVDLRDMVFVDARTDISGAGNVALTMAGGELAGSLSGASNLTYYGSVSKANIDRSGITNIDHRRGDRTDGDG